MGDNLKEWQRSVIRNNMLRYREALRNYYIKDKRIAELEDGHQAFSLLSPAFGTPASKRRLRFIMNNIIDPKTVVHEDGTVSWGARTPHFVTISVTYDCQCDCAHCSASDYRESTSRNGDAMAPDEIKRAVREAVALGATCVVFTGGEPLLHGDIFDLIRSVDKTKSVCAVFTNGELLNEKNAAGLKKAGTFGVFVSLDFSDAERHDDNRRRKGLFDKAVNGIRICQREGMLTGISTFATKDKISSGELDAMMELGRRLGVLEVFLFDIIATGKLDGKTEEMLSGEDVGFIKKFREKYNLIPDYPRILHQSMFTSIAYPCAAEGCPAGVAQMHIRANGDVSPCDFTPVSFGNIRHTPLREIWKALTEHEIYSKKFCRCRLSDPELRRKIMGLGRTASVRAV